MSLARVHFVYAQPITHQVTEVTCPTIGQAQFELAPNKRQKMGPGHLRRCSNSHCSSASPFTLQWRHNERDDVSNDQPHNCLLNSLFRRISKKTSKLRVIGLCERNSPVTGEFPAQRSSYAENISIWWRHHHSISRASYIGGHHFGQWHQIGYSYLIRKRFTG